MIISTVLFLGYASMVLYELYDQNISTSMETTEIVEGHEPVVVLELFTSQGCSSCPAADVLLNKVRGEFVDEVYALSYHVDYWNYIGWKDPFSKTKYGLKQREYNSKFGYGGNYTPQLVVNGKEHIVGSNSQKVYAKIGTYKKMRAENGIELETVEVKGSEIKFNYTILGDIVGKNLKTVLVLNQRTTKVKRGENKNRTLKNANIVVAEKQLTLKTKSGKNSVMIPEEVKTNEDIQLMVFVEKGNYDITGATKIKIER